MMQTNEQRLKAAKMAWAAEGYPPDGPLVDERDDAIRARLTEMPSASPGQQYAVTDDGDLVLCKNTVGFEEGCHEVASNAARYDGLKRDTLTALFDRLGGDGVVPSLNHDPPAKVADAIVEHVRWLEATARIHALMDLCRAVGLDPEPLVKDEALATGENKIREAVTGLVRPKPAE